MSANPLELFTDLGSLHRPAEMAGASAFSVERRKRVRLKVHWPVLLFSNAAPAAAVESHTQNLSSVGFYCLSKTPFTVGELLTCTMRVPTYDPRRREPERTLECRVRVVRVEAVQDRFGVACEIQDYRLVQVHGPHPH